MMTASNRFASENGANKPLGDSPNQSKSESQLKRIPITDLIPDATNPRKHNRTQVRAIANSIQNFGFNAPILIDRNNQIVAGHGRYEAAKLLNLAEVPVISLEHLTETRARAYMLADNKLTDRSQWDDTKVAIHLKELSELALDFEIEAIGFELPEIDFRIQSLDRSDASDRADEFEPATGPAVSVLGDLWLLGEHRLLCGSALDASGYDRLLDTEKAAGIFTDPPYNVKIQGHVGGRGSISHREFAMAAGEMSEEEFTDFLTDTFEIIRGCTIAGGLIYACIDWRHMSEMQKAGHSASLELINLCVWAKINGGMGSLYRSRHELVFVFRNGRQQHLNNVQLGRHGRYRTNVWNYEGANGFRGHANDLPLHPTVKPIALVADAILDSTKRHDIVLDPFLGSGTTLLAAERTKRRARGIELDPGYVASISFSRSPRARKPASNRRTPSPAPLWAPRYRRAAPLAGSNTIAGSMKRKASASSRRRR
jgi:DNA modification methylase